MVLKEPLAASRQASPVLRLHGRALEEVGEAWAVLKRHSLSREDRIHEARKSLKRIRTMLRLLADSYPPELEEAATSLARLTGRTLGALRDRDILPEIVGKLLKNAGREELREPLLERLLPPEGKKQIEKIEARLMTRGGELITGLRTILAEKPGHCDRSGVDAGLRRIYRRGRRLSARKNLSVVEFHSLRKRVKDLHHIAQFFEDEKLERSTKKLGDLLGEHQDLVVLEETAEAKLSGGSKADRDLLDELLKLSRARRQVLGRKSLSRARRLYKAKARMFVAGLQPGA